MMRMMRTEVHLVPFIFTHPALLQLVTREDTLKEKHSGPGCDKLRTITKNCKDKEEREGGEYSVFSLL